MYYMLICIYYIVVVSMSLDQDVSSCVFVCDLSSRSQLTVNVRSLLSQLSNVICYIIYIWLHRIFTEVTSLYIYATADFTELILPYKSSCAPYYCYYLYLTDSRSTYKRQTQYTDIYIQTCANGCVTQGRVSQRHYYYSNYYNPLEPLCWWRSCKWKP